MADKTLTIKNSGTGTLTLSNVTIGNSAIATYNSSTKKISIVGAGTTNSNFNMVYTKGSINKSLVRSFNITGKQNKRQTLIEEYQIASAEIVNVLTYIQDKAIIYFNPASDSNLAIQVDTTTLPISKTDLVAKEVLNRLASMENGVTCAKFPVLGNYEVGLGAQDSYTDTSFDIYELKANANTLPVYFTSTNATVYNSGNLSISNRFAIWYRNGAYEIATIQYYIDNRNDGLFVNYSKNQIGDYPINGTEITALENKLNRYRDVNTIISEYNATL